ncbi:hypothetical protein QYM36_007066 [Artemia franciscana]|uniref:Reverse transcriptase domain-containing protein n=1 Tax=Artemia franciscana TaxID=6661 RepID=A0AA88HX96_ARTSF|nr:hypothetical protein QYM36_007066 [Artemia franciscana]
MGYINQIFTMKCMLRPNISKQRNQSSFILSPHSTQVPVVEFKWLCWKMLVLANVVRLFQVYFKQTRIYVQVDGELFSLFNIQITVKYGRFLFLELFNFVIDWILNEVMQNCAGINISLYFNVTCLDHMEDVLLLGSSFLEMQDILQREYVAATLMGFKISIEKTKLVTDDEF